MLQLPIQEHRSCPVCHLGRMHQHFRVYVRQYGETLISVPHTSAWECDVCHHQQFDPAAIQRIETLIGQAGPPPNRHEERVEPSRNGLKSNSPQTISLPAEPLPEAKPVKPRPKLKSGR